MNSTLFPELVVNGEVIPHAVVAAETQNQEAPKDKPGLAWRKAANAIAIRTLLLQEARSLAIEVDQQKVGPGRFETEEEALIRGLLEQAIEVSPPSEADIHAEWEKDPDRFRAPPLWEVSHILCACDPRDKAGRAKALQRSLALLAAIECAPKGFAALAARDSDCSSKSSGGALGQLGLGDTVPEFEAALLNLSEGEITAEPVLSRHGYHIIRMDAVALGQVLPFEAIKSKIAVAIEKSRWTRNASQYVDHLVATATIEGADFKTA